MGKVTVVAILATLADLAQDDLVGAGSVEERRPEFPRGLSQRVRDDGVFLLRFQVH